MGIYRNLLRGADIYTTASPSGELTVYAPSSTPLLVVPITDGAKHEQELMKKDQISLEWASDTALMLPMGAYVEWAGIRYYLAEPYFPESKDLGEYKFKPTFKHEIYLLSKVPFMLSSESGVESDWNYTGSFADLKTNIETAISNATGRTYKVEVSSALTKALQLSFSNVDIITALNNIANYLECEWWADEFVNGYTGNLVIHFDTFCVHEGGNTSTLRLTAGIEVGYPSSNNKSEFYNRFYVFGSTRNIPQDYNGAQANAIVNKRLTLSPTLHPHGYIDLPKFDDDGNVLVTADDNGYPFYDADGAVSHFVPDESVTSGRTFTKVITLDDIYPHAELKVKSVQRVRRYVRDSNDDIVMTASGEKSTYYWYYITLVDGDGNLFTINKSTYSPDSNPSGSLIKGQTLSLHFKTGALTGREFEATYHDINLTKKDEDGANSISITNGTFEIVHTEDNTIILPNDGIAPQVGDEVIVFNIRMPESYITAGYKELEREAMVQIYNLSKDSNEYTVKSNEVYFAENAPQLSLGRHVHFSVSGRKIDTRVIKLTTHLDRSFEQEIGFCKNISKGTISSLITTLSATRQSVVEVQTEDSTALKIQKKQLYDAQREQIGAMFDTDGYFTPPISPVTLQTQIVAVGAKSTNFVLSDVLIRVNQSAAGTAIAPNHVEVISNNGKLTHYGIGENIREWNIDSMSYTLPTNSAYYIYAQCYRAEEKTGGVLVFSRIQYKYDEDPDVYRFLVGTISSINSATNTRVLSLTYGTTVVNGENITTGVIKSLDGKTYFNLNTGEIVGNISFKAPAGSDNYMLINDLIGSNSSVSKAVADASSAISKTGSGGSRNILRNTGRSVTLSKSYLDINWQNGVWRWSSGGTINRYQVDVSALKTATGCECTKGWRFEVNNTQDSASTYSTVSQDAIRLDSGVSYAYSFYVMVINKTVEVVSYMWNHTKINYASEVLTKKLTMEKVNGNYTWYYVEGTFVAPAEPVGFYFGLTGNSDTTGIAIFSGLRLEVAPLRGAWTPSTWDLQQDANEAMTEALTAQDTAQTAQDTAQTAQATAQTAQATAQTAQATAQTALSTALERTVRNYALGTATPTDIFVPATNYNQYNIAVSREFRDANVQKAFKVTASYIVHGWTQSFAPVTQISLGASTQTGDSWGLRLTFSTYKGLSGGGRLYYATCEVPVGANIGNIGSTGCIKLLCEKNNGTRYPSSGTQAIEHLMLEKGSTYSDWQPAPEDSDYLRASLLEATQGTTDITGGLVLTSFIGVRDSNNMLQAGMTATDLTESNTMPMIFAGRTNSNQLGAFRVYKDGKVQSVNENNTSNYGEFDDGMLNFYLGGQIKNVITSDSMGSITDAMGNLSTTTKGATATDTINLYSSASIIVNNGQERNSDESIHKSTEYSYRVSGNEMSYARTFTLLEPQEFDGRFSTDNEIKVKVTNYNNENPQIGDITGSSPNVTMQIKAGTTVLVTQTRDFETNTTYTLSRVVNKEIKANTKVTLDVKVSGQAEVRRVKDTEAPTGTLKQEISVQSSFSVQGTFVAEFYKDTMYADGLLMSNASNKYFGVDPQARDGRLLAWAHGNAQYKMTTNGLLWSGGSSNMYRVNPLVLIIRLKYNNGTYNSETLYNPLNKTGLQAARNSTGLVTITHKIGHTSYSVLGVGYQSTAMAYISVRDKSTDSCQISIQDDASTNDYNVEVMFFDYKSY